MTDLHLNQGDDPDNLDTTLPCLFFFYSLTLPLPNLFFILLLDFTNQKPCIILSVIESPSVDPISLSKRGRTPSSSLTPGIKRGPGRPRMRPFMPGSRGTRGPSRARKAPAPLQVPISRTSASSSPARSSGAETPRPYGFYTPGSSGPE